MRRADRLFRIVDILRSREITTAAYLGERLDVSERTIYRDVSDLSTSGVPIESEAGLGYALRNYEVPPLVFSIEEIEALVLGGRIVEGWGDPELAEAARTVREKVDAALPKNLREQMRRAALLAPARLPRSSSRVAMPELRRAVRDRLYLDLHYLDAEEQQTERRVRPLALAFFGPTWLIVSWCELRRDFRNFRPDRVESMTIGDSFPKEAGRELEDYLAQEGVCEDRERSGPG